MAENQGLTVASAISIMDKTMARSHVKLEEILEDVGGMRQLFSQIITNYEQQLVELRKGNQELTQVNMIAKKHIEELERQLGNHVAVDQLPPRPKELQRPEPEIKTQK